MRRQTLAGRLYALTRQDDYGVRDAVLHSAVEFLPEAQMRDIIQRLWDESGAKSAEHEARSCFLAIESLAEQLKDGQLYEKSVRAALKGLPDTKDVPHAACVDIARVYYRGGNAHAALSWLAKVPENDDFTAVEREPLLLEIHQHLRNRVEAERVAWRIFRRQRSLKSLEDLLAVIGKESRESVVEDEIQSIVRGKRLSSSDAGFLLELDHIDEAESYLLNHVQELNGSYYSELLRFADAMENADRCLVASLIYRALLESILERATSKYYGHGVRYLRKLDQLAGRVRSWKRFPTHDEYALGITKSHARKSAFWALYNTKKSW